MNRSKSERVLDALSIRGVRLSNFAERHGQDWLVYNPLLFVHYHRTAERDADEVAGAMTSAFPDAHSFLDVGAGSGAHAAALRRRGKEVFGVEKSAVGRAFARLQGVRTEKLDLASDRRPELPIRPAVAYSFEVAEHLDLELGLQLVRYLAQAAAWVVFSAAQPGQGGEGHRNEQPLEYWSDQFLAAGMTRDEARTNALRRELLDRDVQAWWLARNCMVFGKPA